MGPRSGEGTGAPQSPVPMFSYHLPASSMVLVLALPRFSCMTLGKLL